MGDKTSAGLAARLGCLAVVLDLEQNVVLPCSLPRPGERMPMTRWDTATQTGRNRVVRKMQRDQRISLLLPVR